MEREERNREIKLYNTRWWIISLIGFVAILARTLSSSFGVVNDVYVAYFNVSYEVVDWFTLIIQSGSAFSCIVIFVFLYSKTFSIRQLALLMTVCLAFTSVCLVTAYIFPKSFPLAFVGNFALGFVIAALDPVTASYAVNWFPEHQIGIALGANEIGANTGSLLGYIIPSNLLLAPNELNSSTNVVWPITSPISSLDQEWLSRNKMRLIIFSSVFLTNSILIIIIFSIFMKSKPPLPPTNAQLKVRLQSNEEEQTKLEKKQLKKIFQLFKSVTLDRVFLQVMFVLSVAVGGCNTVAKVFFAELFRKLLIELGYKSSYNSISGLLLMCYECGSIFGSILSGKFVDHFKNYHQQISIVLGCCVLSTTFILLGSFFESIAAVFVFNFTFGMCLGYLPTPSYEIVLQHYYPLDSGVLSIMMRMLFSLIVLCLGEIPRLISNLLPGGMAVYIYMIIIQLLSFFLSLFLKPNYNRLAVSQNSHEATSQKEEAPLLKNSN